MSFLSGLFDVAKSAIGGIIGGGSSSSPISGLVETAGKALGGFLGDATGDKIGDKVGDVIGDIIGSDKLGDKVGDLLGGAIGGESKITDFLSEKAGGIGEKVGELFGSENAGGFVGGILGSQSEETSATTRLPEEATSHPGLSDPMPQSSTNPDTIDLSQLSKPMEAGELTVAPEIDTEMGENMGEFDGEMSEIPDLSTMEMPEMSIAAPEQMMI